ncbi:hypothetical protein QJQ45_012772 [Haematococcus lacustris]|nr:hypothetical protein QJQ45_012772 [Haematococcus lacustris]
MAELTGKTAVIFGGSSGMGKGTAVAVKTSVVDTTDEGAVKTFFAAIPAGSIHHLVCTTGPSLAGGAFLDVPMDKIRAQYDAKLFSAMHVAKYGAPALADGGSLTFLSGALARRPGKWGFGLEEAPLVPVGSRLLCCWLLNNRGSAALATVNAALDALAKALAGELGPRLRVNCLSPGLVDTEMWDSMPEDVKAKMLAGFGASIPAGRAGTIDDIGHGAVFLMTNPWAPPPAPAQDQPPAQAPPGPVQRPQAPPWGRWLDRVTNPCLNFQRIGESKQRPLELCSWTDLKALPPVGKEYQQRYKLVNDRLPKVRQRLHRAAEYRRGIDGRARNNAQALVVCTG